jgi:hypothetical protein
VKHLHSGEGNILYSPFSSHLEVAMQFRTCVSGLALVLLASFTASAQSPLAEKFLLEGKLTDGIRALEARLAAAPKDDQARFGLGVTQFLRSFEKLGANFHRYGLRTERSFVRLQSPWRELLVQNPKPEEISYRAAREVVKSFADDLAQAEKTLAAIADDSVKLPLQVGRIKIDPLGSGTPIAADFILRQQPGIDPAMIKQVESFSVGFDRGDVCWLRGYCHLLMAWCDVLLSIDGQELFHCGAHLLFEKVETPYAFLLENRTPLDSPPWSSPENFMDFIALFHLSLRLPIEQPERLKSAHHHLKQTVAMSREMWSHFNKETDDDRELIPNPKQAGAAGVPVSVEMQKAWLDTLDEFEKILDGKALIPFWRPVFGGAPAVRGVNVHRAFHELKEFDLILWIQGTAAVPFLEDGEMTALGNPTARDGLLRPFGRNFLPFMFWFN